MDPTAEEEIPEKHDHEFLDDRLTSRANAATSHQPSQSASTANVSGNGVATSTAADHEEGSSPEVPRAAKITVIKKTTIPKPPTQPRYDFQQNATRQGPPRHALGRRLSDSARSESSSNVYTSSSNDESSDAQSTLVTNEDDELAFEDEPPPVQRRPQQSRRSSDNTQQVAAQQQQQPPAEIFNANLDMFFPEIGSDPAQPAEPAKKKGGIGRKLNLMRSKDAGESADNNDYHLLSLVGEGEGGDNQKKNTKKANKSSNNKKNPKFEEPDSYVQNVALALQCFGGFFCLLLLYILYRLFRYMQYGGYFIIVMTCVIILVGLVGGLGWFLYQIVNEEDTPIRKEKHLPRWFRVAKKIIRQELLDFRNDWRDMMNGIYLLEDGDAGQPTQAMAVDSGEATAATSAVFSTAKSSSSNKGSSNNNKKKSRSVIFKMVAKPAAVFANYRRKRKEKKKQKKTQQGADEEAATYDPPSVYVS